MTRTGRRVASTAAVAVVMVLVAACSHVQKLRWPWSATPAPPPERANELVVMSEDGAPAAFAQYWKRNTLVLDLQGASGTGGAVLKPREGTQWPVRLAFRVAPGRIGMLEVKADRRVVLPITAEGSQPVDLELEPGVYTPRTDQMTVRWRPRSP